MILVDTSVIVAWLDRTHPDHEKCSQALENCGAVDELAINSVTFAELAAGGRTRESLDEILNAFSQLDLDFNSAFRAGLAFRQYRPGKVEHKPVLPDFLIRGQAAILGMRHLTNDHRRIHVFPDVDFLFPTDEM